MRKFKLAYLSVLAFLGLFMLVNFIGMSWYNDDWSTYGVNLIARMGGYADYFVAQGAVEFATPQIFVDYFIIFFLELGLSYEVTLMSIYLLSCIVLIIGIMAFVQCLDIKSKFVASVIAVIYFCYNNFGYGISGNTLWQNSLIHASFANAIAVWALYFCYKAKKQYFLSYLMCGIASLIHLQVGFYFGVVILVYQLVDSISRKEKFKTVALIPWVIPVLSSTLILFAGTKKLLGNIEFVELYGRLRHPHHMIPGTWALKGYALYILFILMIFILYFAILQKSEENRRDFIWIGIITAGTAVALLMNFIFTDLIPWSLMIKVQPARMVSVLLICLLVPLIKACDNFISEKAYFPAMIFVLSIFFSKNDKSLCIMTLCILISYCLFSLSVKTNAAKYRTLDVIFKYINVTSLYFGIAGSLIYYVIFKDAYSLLIFCVFIYIFVFEIKLLRSVKMLLIITPLIIFSIIAASTSDFFAKNVNQSLYVLATRFEKSTPDDTIFYANPRDSAFPAFTLFSHRSPVVFFKNVPINDGALIEWRNRLIETRVIEQAGDSFRFPSIEPDVSDIIDIARKYKAGYILIYSSDAKKYLDTKKVELYDSEGAFSLLRIS